MDSSSERNSLLIPHQGTYFMVQNDGTKKTFFLKLLESKNII
jgi:hypothetical protein